MNVPVKLSPYAMRRFFAVHAWAGVLTSLVVYFMFALGAVVLFYDALTVWEEPLRQRPAPALTSLQAPLALAGPLPEEFYYYLPVDDRGPPKLAYFLPGTTSWRMWWLDVEGGRLLPQRELAAAYVYDLHYLWHEATGYALQYGAGVLVFGFLLAIITGVLIHLRELLPQLHRFRPERSPRVWFSDLHKVTGTFGLPFQLIYAWTGTLMALSPLLFQLSIDPVFGGDSLRAARTAGPLIEEPPERDYGAARAPLSLDVLVARARQAEPRLTPESFVYRGHQRELGTVDVRGPIEGQPFGEGLVRVRAADGEVELVSTPDGEPAVGTVARWMHGLHTVEYGGNGVRILVFMLAVAAGLTLLTGNWVWLQRRRARKPSFGDALLARMTAGVGAGTLVALGALFLGSRLLPLDWAPRTHVEELCLALALGASLAVALCVRDPRRSWVHLLTAAGAQLVAVPFAATLHSGAGLFGAGPRDAIVAAVEVGFLITGALLLAAAWAVQFSTARQPLPAPASSAYPPEPATGSSGA